MKPKNSIAFSPKHARTLRVLLRDDSGVAAIEFAFVAPILLWLMMAIIEYGIIFHIHSLASLAAGEAARMGKTGDSYTAGKGGDAGGGRCMSVDPTRDKTALIKCVVEGYLSPWMSNGSSVTVSATSYGKFYTRTAAGAAGLGDADELVLYAVRYDWDIITPILTPLFEGQPLGATTLPITAVVFVKNEDF